MKKIMAALEAASPSLYKPMTESEILINDQWTSFAIDTVYPELTVTHDLDGNVFGPLQEALDRRTFLTGALHPALSDWLLFSILFSRIVFKAFLSS